MVFQPLHRSVVHGSHLRQLTLHEPALIKFSAVALLLTTCLSLDSLQLLDFVWPLATINEVHSSVAAFLDVRRQASTAPSAPLTSLALRLAPHVVQIRTTELPVYLSFLFAVAPTLVRLHVSEALASTMFLLPLAFEEIGGNVRSLRIGFDDWTSVGPADVLAGHPSDLFTAKKRASTDVRDVRSTLARLHAGEPLVRWLINGSSSDYAVVRKATVLKPLQVFKSLTVLLTRPRRTKLTECRVLSVDAIEALREPATALN